VGWSGWSTSSRSAEPADGTPRTQLPPRARRIAREDREHRAKWAAACCRAVATWGGLLRQAAEVGLRLVTQAARKTAQERTRQDRTQRDRPRQERRTSPPARAERPAHPRPSTGGARTAPARDCARRVAYAPDLDGAADPGEIVWTWVPFEEDDGRGKDRPVLVVGREGRDLVGLMLSSQSERADDRNWIGIGTGAWDGQGRPSYVRLDRVIEVGEHEIRREGAMLDERRFERVADALRSGYGWS
jgi:hypothetical protein